MTTVEEAQEWLSKANKTKQGAICPCCERFDKVYHRKIHEASIKDLVQLYEYSVQHGFKLHHWRSLRNFQRSDFSKFKFLRLVEQGEHVGWWRITELGVAFVRGEVSIPEKIVVYHDELVGTEGDMKLITDFWPTFKLSEI